MIYSNSAAVPRAELQGVIMQGRGINAQNIGQKVLPLYGVDKRNGHLVNLSIAGGELLRITDKIVAPGANIERINLTFGGTTFLLVVRKEEVVIPDEVELDFSDYFSTEAIAAQTGLDRLELTHEFLVSAAILNTTTFGAATNAAVAYTLANIATISFIADVYAAIERVRDKGEDPNTIVIPALIYQRIRQSTIPLGFIRGSIAPAAEINSNTIQQVFADEGITQVLIGRSRYNSAATGATPTLQKVWGSQYIWVGRVGNTFIEGGQGEEGENIGVPTVSGVGATLFWEPYGAPWMTETYREEAREANIVRVKMSAVPFIANANAGTLINTNYA